MMANLSDEETFERIKLLYELEDGGVNPGETVHNLLLLG
jgi:hypothetical protein